jgi:hypothetical protein
MRSDLWKLLIIVGIVALAGGLVGGVLGLFAGAGYCYCPPPVETLAASRLPRLKLDSRTDKLVFEVEGHLTQTTNLVEAQQYTETVVFSISNDGDVLISGTLTISDGVAFAGDLDVKGYISATSNITSATVVYGVGMDAGDDDIDNVANIAVDTISADDGSSFAILNDWTNAGNTIADLGTVTTADVNGGAIDGTIVGGSLAAAGSFTTLVITSTSDLQGNVSNSVGGLSIVDTVEITGAVHLQGSGLSSDYFAGVTYGDLGSAKSVDASTGPSHVLPIQVNIQNTANPASAKTIAAAYLKAATATADQANAQICGVLPRVTIEHDVASSYGTQSHSTRSGDADVAGEFCAGSFKLDVGSGAQMSGENWAMQAVLDGSAAKSSSNSTGVGRFQLYANANADYLVHLQAATGSTVSQGLYVSNHGTMGDAVQINSTGDGTVVSGIDMLGTFSGYGLDMSDATIGTAEIRGSNSETIANTTDGEWDITGDIDGAGEFQVGTWLNLTVQTEISVTNGAVFTPTGTYQLIAALAEVTPTISTSGFKVGDQLELHNTETPVINFEASGTLLLKDDYPMDQYDVLGLRWIGSAWVELYRTGPRI